MIFFITGIVFILDQVTKWTIIHFLQAGESVPVFKNIFHISVVFNTGAAFGIFKGSTPVFILASIITILCISGYIINRRAHRQISVGLPMALILGGAMGNLVDRIRLGFVIDFLDFRIWPVFNIADSAITVGVTILALRCILFSSKSAQ